MLKAQALKDGSFIFAPEIDDLGSVQNLSQDGGLVCPHCQEPVHVKAGRKKIWHFAHNKGRGCGGPDGPDYRPESREHKLLKWVLYKWLLGSHQASLVHVEAKIENHFGGRQFADVWLDLESSVGSSGCQFAFEIQRSPITPDEWKRRHEGYRSQGIHDEWILIGEAFDIGQHGDTFRLGGLPRTIVEETGRLLWIEGAAVQHVLEINKKEINKKIVDDEKEGIPTPGQVQIRVLEPIAGHHSEVRGDPTGHALWLEDKNPGKEHLLEKGPWRKTLQGPSLTVEGENTQLFPLSQLHVAKKNPFVVLGSPLASSTKVYDAWRWEMECRRWVNR